MRSRRSLVRRSPSYVCVAWTRLFSAPSKAGAFDPLRRLARASYAIYSESARLYRNCPRRFPRRSFDLEDSAAWVALRHHRKSGKAVLQKLAPASPTSRWPERYGRFQLEICSTSADLFVSQCLPERGFSVRGKCATDPQLT